MKNPSAVAQAQLDAYNAQDLDAHCAYFGDDVKIADFNGAVSLEGLAAYRARYDKVFADFPENKAILVSRIAVGNIVIDHERVSRSPTSGAVDFMTNGPVPRRYQGIATKSGKARGLAKRQSPSIARSAFDSLQLAISYIQGVVG
jgi:hypothetical protein